MNLLTTERRLTRWWFLVVDLSLSFLKTKTTDEVLQQSGKEDPFRHMLKSSACMYEVQAGSSLEPPWEIQ